MCTHAEIRACFKLQNMLLELQTGVFLAETALLTTASSVRTRVCAFRYGAMLSSFTFMVGYTASLFFPPPRAKQLIGLNIWVPKGMATRKRSGVSVRLLAIPESKEDAGMFASL